MGIFMITITAVIRVRKGTESVMRDALCQVAAYVRDHQPGTIDFFVSAGVREPNVFTTYERFTDQNAMEAHCALEVVKQVHRVAAPILEAPITLESGEEIASKQ
jgi:quinol monooxygenase YgiN